MTDKRKPPEGGSLFTRLQRIATASNICLTRDICDYTRETPTSVKVAESLARYCVDLVETICLVVRAFRRCKVSNQITARNGYIKPYSDETSMAPESMKTVGSCFYSHILWVRGNFTSHSPESI